VTNILTPIEYPQRAIPHFNTFMYFFKGRGVWFDVNLCMCLVSYDGLLGGG